MGKNKGKGASNLRRLNSQKKQVRHWDNVHSKIKEAGLSVSFTKSETILSVKWGNNK